MISKKYVDDYKSEIKTDQNGKVTKNYRYSSDYYSFDVPDEKAMSLRIQLLIFVVGMAFVYFVPLFMYSTLTRVVYVVIPYIIVLIPIYLLGKAVSYLFRNHGQLKREEKEKSFDRLKGIPYFMFFLLLGEVMAQIIGYAKWQGQIAYGDYILSGTTVLLILLTVLFLKKTQKIKIKIIKNNNTNI